MTLKRVESDFGNSSCSSMASFMSCLLQDNFERFDVQPEHHFQINIVDDNAKIGTRRDRDIPRCNSLVTMRRQRSGRQLSRWSNSYQPRDSDQSLMTFGRRRAPRGSGGLQKSTSDTMLLQLPARSESPRLPSREESIATSIGRSGNATWSDADVEKSNRRVERSEMFDLALDISLSDCGRTMRPNLFLNPLSTVSLERSSCDHKPRMKHDDACLGMVQPVRRPSVQHFQHPQQDERTKFKVPPSGPTPITPSISSNSKGMDKMNDPTSLGIQMHVSRSKNLLSSNGPSSSRLKASATSFTSGRPKTPSQGSSLATFEQALQRSSTGTATTRRYLNDPSLLGLNVKMGTKKM